MIEKILPMMSKPPKLGDAIFLASYAHLGQEDKGGHSYILHPLRAMFRLRVDEDDELMMIMVMHDVLEDSDEIKVHHLQQAGFSQRVIDALLLLTHEPGVPYDVYVEGMIDNIDAILCKIEDLRDNSDITRIKGLSEKDFKRSAKYMICFDRLKKARNKLWAVKRG